MVISEIDEDGERGRQVRRAHFIGRARDFEDLDLLMDKYNVLGCIISGQPEPHLVERWRNDGRHHGHVRIVDLMNDGSSKPEWGKWDGRISVDRTLILNSAYDEIRERVRDLTSGDLKYRWTETV